MKYYCHVCDKVDFYSHCREHFNWQEYATPERIEQAEERRMGWDQFITKRLNRTVRRV